MLLDDRLRDARAAADLLPVDEPPAIEVLVRRARRRHATIGVTLAFVLIAGVAAAWFAAARTDSTRHPAPVDAPPLTTSPTSTPTVVATTAAPILGPVPFGDGELRYVPGAWDIDAAVSVTDGAVRVATADASATLTDEGPAPDPDGAVDDPDVSLEQVPRLGPYGPTVTIEEDGATTTASVVVAGRRVVARSDSASPAALLQLLRSVTTADALRPIRPDAGMEVELADVVGLDYRDATRELEAAGVRVLWTLGGRAEASVGVVESTSPAAGSRVASGSAVVVTVSAPATHIRGAAPFVPVVGGPRVDAPGYMVLWGGSPEPPAPIVEAPVTRDPVVFLHGELVGLWGTDGDLFEGAPPLADLVDPEYRYEPPPPSPTVPPQALTQTAALGDVEVDVPTGWAIRAEECPATRSVVVGTVPDGCGEPPPGPWISLQPAPSALTPCRAGGIGTERSGGNLRACWTDNLSDGVTDAFVLLGSGAQVVNRYGSAMLQDHADMRAAVDSLRAPSSRGEVVHGPFPLVVDAVAALMDGRCDELASYLSPLDAEPPACVPRESDGAVTDAGEFAASMSAPVDHLDDMTYEAWDVTPADGSTWHVESRTYYDPESGDVVAYITRIDPPA